MKPILIYCYDAYCGWCYGFSPVITRIWKEYKDIFQFEVLSGGMILSENPPPISATSDYISKAYKVVEEKTGIRFGEDYLWHIFNPDKSDWFPDSRKPAIAMTVFKEYFPDEQVPFASDLQWALHYEGRDLCDDEAYRHLLKKYQVPEEEFYEALHSELYRNKAMEEIALVKQLQVTGFPTVLLQHTDQKIYLLSRGYTTYETLHERIQHVVGQAG